MTAYDYFNNETGLITKRDRLLALLRRTRKHYCLLCVRLPSVSHDNFRSVFDRLDQVCMLQCRIKDQLTSIEDQFNRYCAESLCI